MTMMAVVTGASSGLGEMIARDLSGAGHIIYASMRDTSSKTRKRSRKSAAHAKDRHVDLRTIELDVQNEASINAALKKIIDENGRLDVLVDNAGHLVYGPSEAFTPNQIAQLYDTNLPGIPAG